MQIEQSNLVICNNFQGLRQKTLEKSACHKAHGAQAQRADGWPARQCPGSGAPLAFLVCSCSLGHKVEIPELPWLS